MLPPRSLLSTGVLALGLSHQAAAVLVYITSYAGTLTTVDLTLPGTAYSNQSASAKAVAVTTGCSPNSSWLSLDKSSGILYCLDEGFGKTAGSLTSFQTSANGTLTTLKRVDTPRGPVSAIVYGDGAKGLAVANYEGAALSSYIKAADNLSEIQTATWTLAQPGKNTTRQTSPHPHEVVVDPTGRFLLVPDLGADFVRVFTINETALTWQPADPPALEVTPGSGPRHVSFVVSDTANATFMYLTTEMTNTVAGYKLTYTASGINFTELFSFGTFGPDHKVPDAASAAEVLTSPDHRFVLVSTRSDHSFSIANFDPTNSTQLVSDTIASFAVDQATGQLTLAQLFPSGGLIPRQFSINKAGTLLGVGQQGSARAVFINRDVASGNLTSFATAIDIAGEVTSVVFDE